MINSDPSDFLNNPSLLGTGDISTTDNDYLRALGRFLPAAVDAAERFNMNQLFSGNITQVLNDTRLIGQVLQNIPSMRFIVVDGWGTPYDLTGFRIRRTNQFEFGVLPH